MPATSDSSGPDPASTQRPEYRAVSRPEERAAARERVARFPYRFPRDPRQIGGKFTVEENARRILRDFYFERRLGIGLPTVSRVVCENNLHYQCKQCIVAAWLVSMLPSRTHLQAS